MSQFLLACDEGTSSVRCVAYDRNGKVVSSSQHPLTSQFPHPGWVEQDANEIWHSQLQCIKEVTEQLNASAADLHALGITNQRETTVVWDRHSGEPVAPAITWQCRRTANQCSQIHTAGDAHWITKRTGLQIDPYFSATKVGWVLDHVSEARERAEAGDLLFGTIDSWLIYQLTDRKQHVIDLTNASRTMLMSLDSGAWDHELLAYFQIPESMMPAIVPSEGVVGYTSGDIVGAEIPIAGIAGDQQAAMVGQQCNQANSAKLTYGTGAFLLVHTGNEAVRSEHGLLATAVATTGSTKEYALEGSVFSAGSAVQWLRDGLGLIASAQETESLAKSVPDTNGVYLVPAFEGLGAPHWSADAKGALVGLTRSTDKRHIARAALESIALQSADLIHIVENEIGQHLSELRVDGGAAANDFLLQFQADLIERPVVRPSNLESTVLGAAILAAKATDFWQQSSYEIDKTFEPTMPSSQREAIQFGWHDAVRRVL